jgi:hypothetical protein
MKNDREASFITQWKNEMKHRIKLRFKNKPLSDKKIDAYLNEKIRDYMVNPQVQIINNYRNQTVTTDLLSLIDTIEDNQLIIGGGGVLYVQHETQNRPNILFDYIINLQQLRSFYKNERKKYDKGTDDWLRFEIFQLNTKIKLNSLYGVHGYDGFVIYNRFIAEAITNCGRQIITTAVMTFENFLGGSIKCNTEEEIYKFITNIIGEYREDIDYSIFNIENIDHKVVKKLVNMCAFDPSDEFILTLEGIVKNLNHGEKALIYYKNNLYEFSDLPFIKDKLKYIIENLDELKAPERKKIKDEVILSYIDEVWNFYDMFVLYNYPMYDRVRKAMFTDRRNVLYVDTDSNFLGLNEWVQYVKGDILNHHYNKDEREVDFIAVNIMAMFLSNVIDRGLHTLCKYMNIRKEYADRLNMKNEFYLDRILFTSAKKRYISNSVLQEGQLLNNGIGLPDIKGFDFKKAGTKPYIREYYTRICLDEILRADVIDVERIYKQILDLKDEIDESMKKGENTFFKQATVQIVDHYKNPYSTQGVVAVLLWNCLNPTYAMELPTDCDIIPIKDLSGPKYDEVTGKTRWKNEEFMMEFKERFPEEYARLEREIYNNPNQLIRNMGLTSLAKPKNQDIEVPPWFEFILDTEKVSLDALDLISPVLKSLGLNGLKTNASTEYMTNIIDL